MPVKKTTKKVAAKKPAAKKAASKKCAEKKACECKCAEVSKQSESCSSKCRKATRVIVKFDAGWGNALFIRGMGAGLDWEKGVPMQCVGEDEWLWEQLVPNGVVAFKVLVNDECWSVGEDFSVAAGDTIICRPAF